MPLIFKSKNSKEQDVINAMKIMALNGIWHKVKHDYDHNRSMGMEPMYAAFDALYKWDLLDYEPDTTSEQQ
jgi:hypothetical protein